MPLTSGQHFVGAFSSWRCHHQLRPGPWSPVWPVFPPFRQALSCTCSGDQSCHASCGLGSLCASPGPLPWLPNTAHKHWPWGCSCQGLQFSRCGGN